MKTKQNKTKQAFGSSLRVVQDLREKIDEEETNTFAVMIRYTTLLMGPYIAQLCNCLE